MDADEWELEGAEGEGELEDQPDDELSIFDLAVSGPIETLQEVLAAAPESAHVSSHLGDTPLHKACQAGNTNAAALLIKYGADVNAKTTTSYTCLFFAIQSKRVSLVKLLLGAGAAVNKSCGPNKITPLFLAVFQHSRRMVRCLLDHKANVKKPTLDPMVTPLNLACREGSEAIVAALLEEGALPLVRTRTHSSALYLAAYGGHEDVVCLLLEELGPDLHLDELNGPEKATALGAAALNGDLAIVEMLLRAGAKHTAPAGATGFLPLHNAARRGHLPVVKHLVESGADLNAMTKRATSVLFHAVKFGHRAVVQYLVANGVRIDDPNQDRSVTALFVAACQGFTGICSDLLAAGADILHQCTDTYATALNGAVRNGHDDTVALLLSKGADHAVPNANGYTGVYIAAEFDRCEILKLLIAAGADVNAACGHGAFPPIYIACKRGNQYCAELLLRGGANPNIASLHKMLTPLFGACRGGKFPLVQLLIEARADLLGRTEKGFGAVYAAAEFGHKHIVKALLSAGVPTDAQYGPLRNTCLHAACENGHASVVAVLLAAKANPDVCSLSKRMTTPLTAAIVAEHDAIALRLLEAGASPVLPNANGATPLFLAARVGLLSVVSALLARGAGVTLELRYGPLLLTPLAAAVMGELDDVAVALIAAGADVGATIGPAGESSALIEAVRMASSVMVTALLNAGADPCAAVGPRRLTPLHAAASVGSIAMADILLDSGAAVSALDSNGDSPLATAVSVTLLPEMVELLLAAGADPDCCGSSGITPLFVAALGNSVSVVQLLLDHKANPNASSRVGAATQHALDAAVFFHLDVIRDRLLEAGATPSGVPAPSEDDWGALWASAYTFDDALSAGSVASEAAFSRDSD